MQENESVVQNPEGAGAAPTAVETPEAVSSPEVKTGVQEVEQPTVPVQKEDVGVSKMQEQINNLNTALRQEREASKMAAKELEEKLANSNETIEKLKNVFSPEKPEEKPAENLTMEQLEALLDSREAKRQEELQKEEKHQKIKNEISTLEGEWNGENGKPKYEDKAVLEWQELNNKLHLSPREAFNEMNRDAIIDWEIKNRMAKKPEVQNVETPGGNTTPREPQEQVPQTDAEIRAAVLEAISNASSENIN